MTLLRRMRPSGRTINIDTMDFAMLNGGQGLAHINMNNSDNRVKNRKWVKAGRGQATCCVRLYMTSILMRTGVAFSGATRLSRAQSR